MARFTSRLLLYALGAYIVGWRWAHRRVRCIWCGALKEHEERS
jgi:hypothetical protein